MLPPTLRIQLKRSTDIPSLAADLLLHEMVSSVWSRSECCMEEASIIIAEMGRSTGADLAAKVLISRPISVSSSSLPGSSPMSSQTGFSSTDAVKLLCKSFWQVAFGKPADKLQSNGVDTYVIDDLSFLYFARIYGCCVPEGGTSDQEEFKDRKNLIGIFVTGLISGALEIFGCKSRAKFDVNVAPPSIRIVIIAEI